MRIAILGLVTLVWSVTAQPIPKINSLSREWVQRGTSSEVTIQGEYLSNAERVIVSGDPGVSAALVRPGAPSVQVESSLGGISSVAPPNNNQVRVLLGITNTASLTERELRLVTSEGVSNPLVLKVGHLPELASREDNKTSESAQSVELPAVISGLISAPSESDFYKFKAKTGERIILDVHAYRLGSQLDSSLAILDPAGKELARNEDRQGLDSVIEFTAPTDGEYTAQLRDFRHYGGGDFRYRLSMGVLPHVTSHFPLGGQRGQTVEVNLTGANLENANKMLLHLAENAPAGRQEIRASTGRGLSNPLSFEVSDLPQFLEREPNSALDQADFVSVPGALNGRIQLARDYDAYKFNAQKDQQFTFEIQANRFGSPLDALLTITDAKGKVLARNDDAAGADARLDYKFPESGEYVVIVEDLLERGGDNYIYRLNVSSSRPDFSVVFLPDTLRLRRAGRVPVRIELTRMNGFEEPVKVQLETLPPGVFAEPLMISGNTGSRLLMLTASAEAALGSFEFKLAASATIHGRSIKRLGEPVSGDRTVKEAFVTVLPELPFAVAPATMMASLEQNQSSGIDVIAERRNGFEGDITITAEGFSARRDPITKSFEIPALVLKGKELRGTLELKAKLDAEIGVRPIYLKAESQIDGQKVAAYGPLLPVGTSEIPFVLSTTLKKIAVTALPPGSDSAASEAFFTVKAARRGGFEGEIALKIEGVPDGVTVTVDKIPEKAGEANIKLVCTEKAPTGKDSQLVVTGTGIFRDKNYKFQPGPITLTVNAPEQPETKLAEAR